MSYNFFVRNPSGAEYNVLNAPARSLSAVLSLLPLGTSELRAVAFDTRYVKRTCSLFQAGATGLTLLHC